MSPEASAAGGGSGCSPGGGQLPDGVWFGFVDGVTDTTIDFDLACFQSCDPGTGFRIGNQNPTTRTVSVRSDAVVIFESPDGPDWQESFERWKNYEDVGLHTMVWIYVNDGTVTHIVQPTAAEGCRFSAVEVDWVAEFPAAGLVAFNDLGLIATAPSAVGDNLFYWRSDRWQSSEPLEGTARGWRGPTVASGDTVGIGAHVHTRTGSAWSTESFDTLGDEVYALSTSGDRVLLSGAAGDEVVVHVLTRAGAGWDVDTITIADRSDWETWAGAISGDTFAISDTGLHTSVGQGKVLVYDWDGTSWTQTATLVDQWDTGMWGSSLDLDGDRLLVGADGATPGPGSRGGLYLYTRTGDTWTADAIAEGGEGFGHGARIDGDTIITAAAHGDPTASLWVFTQTSDGWAGTPIQLDTPDDWIYGIDVLEPIIAVSTRDAVQIGEVR
jgi:hypothetical protein